MTTIRAACDLYGETCHADVLIPSLSPALNDIYPAVDRALNMEAARLRPAGVDVQRVDIARFEIYERATGEWVPLVDAWQVCDGDSIYAFQRADTACFVPRQQRAPSAAPTNTFARVDGLFGDRPLTYDGRAYDPAPKIAGSAYGVQQVPPSPAFQTQPAYLTRPGPGSVSSLTSIAPMPAPYHGPAAVGGATTYDGRSYDPTPKFQAAAPGAQPGPAPVASSGRFSHATGRRIPSWRPVY